MDALRGLAAIAVVLHHYTGGFANRLYPAQTGAPLPLSFSLVDGHFGVDLFFMISGFVITLTLDRSPRAYDFIGSRVARLWPAYLCCLAITATVILVWELPFAARPGVWGLLAHLTMAPSLFDAPFLDGSYWTLSYELVFYVLAATVYYRLGPRRIEIACLTWLLMKAGLHFLEAGRLRWWLSSLLAIEFAPLFVIGVMLYRIRSGQATRVSYAVLVLALTLGGMGIPYTPYRPIPTPYYFTLLLVLTSLVWIGTLDRSVLRFLYPLVLLGIISYPLYLIHQILGFAVLNKLLARGVGPDVSVLTTICFVLLLATGIHLGVEKPARKAIRKRFDQWRELFTGEPPAATVLRNQPPL